MKTCTPKRPANIRSLLTAASLAVLTTTLAHGATLTWDSDSNGTNGITDGAGTWNTANTNWYPGGTAPQTDTTWANTTADIAVFGNGGVGGTVTVGTVNAGGITFNATTTTAYTLNGGAITLGTGAIIDNNSAVAPTISSALSGSNIVFQADSSNTASAPMVTISGNNSNLTGTTTIGGGSNKLVAFFNNVNSLGTSAVTVNNGNTLRLGAPGTYSNNFTVAGTGPAARGAISFGGTTAARTSQVVISGQVTLTGNTLISNTAVYGLGVISGNIVESTTSTLSIQSQNTPLAISGNNTYSGGTVIQTGGSTPLNERVLFNNTAGSATGTGNITMASTSAAAYATIGGGNDAASGGTASIRGTGANAATSGVYAAGVRGMLSGTVSTGNFSHLAPGNGTQATATAFNATVGTLTVGALTLGQNNVLDYNFNTTNNTNDFVAVTGALTLGTSTTVNLFQENSTTAYLTTAGTYNLFSYGTLGGDVSSLSVAAASQQSGFTYTFTNDAADGLIQLTVTAVPEPSTYMMGMLALLTAGVALWRRRTQLF